MDTQEDVVEMDQDLNQAVLDVVNSQNISRKRNRPDLPPHNEEGCDCSQSSWTGEDDSLSELEIPPKFQKMDTAETESGAPGLPASRQRKKQVDLNPEVLRAMSPRTLHQTLMDSVDFDNVSDPSSSPLHSSMFEDSDHSPRRTQPPEYEIATFSPSHDNPNPIEDMTSTTDDENLDTMLRSWSSSSSSDWSAKDEAERDNFADSSDSESDIQSKGSGISTDSELSEKDKWFCSQCNAKTNNPYFRYCLRCFNLRRNWLPKRPTGRKLRPPPLPKVHRKRLRAAYTCLPSPEEHNSIPCSTPETERSSSGSSKEKNILPSTSTSITSSFKEVSSLVGQNHTLTLELQSTLNAPPVSVAVATGAVDDPLCIICMGREKNAAFVHGKSAHFCCCFICGDKILKKAGKCPVCRKKILRVVKIIF